MMSWLQRWWPSLGGKLRQRAPHIEAVAAHAYPYAGEPDTWAAQSSLYQQSSAVYLAVNRIAEAAALVPLHVYRLAGEQRIAVPNHPLEQLLNAPNPFMSRFELIEQTIGLLELTGNAYWFIAGDARGQPAELWLLRPDRMAVVPDAEAFVRGYLYSIDGKLIPLDAVEVIHFKRWHPANDYYGFSALAAARLTLQTDRAMAVWNYNTFGQDNGVPAGIVSIKDYISDTDFERIRQEWRGSYGGARRRTAFLRGGSVEWHNIGLSHTELDFLQGRKAHRDDILTLFGIPIGLVSENATEANAKVAERLFIERTLYPKLVRLAQKITQELLPFYPGTHSAEFEDIRPTDQQARLAEIRAAERALSINEIRQQYYALPPVTWGAWPVGLRPALPAAVPTEAEPPVEAAEDVPSAGRKSGAWEELAQWERFVLRRGAQPGTRAFKVTQLPDELAFEISARLLLAADKAAIKAVFAAARAQLAAVAPPADHPATPLATP